MNSYKAIEIPKERSKIRSFVIEDTHNIFVVNLNNGSWMVLHEDAFDEHTGEVEFLSHQEFKEKYNFEL